jgi:hypothetical protein
MKKQKVLIFIEIKEFVEHKWYAEIREIFKALITWRNSTTQILFERFKAFVRARIIVFSLIERQVVHFSSIESNKLIVETK